jgi:hypothetical protein
MRQIRVARCLPYLIVVNCLGVAQASAQAPADRATLLALRDSTLRLASPEAVTGLAQPLRGSGTARDVLRLNNALVSERIGELTLKRKPFIAAGETLDRVARPRKAWPFPWYGAGLTERALALGNFSVLPSPIHALGFDYNQSAVIAFTQALRADSTFAPAADGVAEALLATTRWGVAKVAVRGLRGTSGVSPATLVLRAVAEREAGERDSTIPILRRALAAGGDSALALFELAREQFLNGKVDPGRSTYFRAVSLVRTPQARTWLKRNLAFAASPHELDGFDELTDTALVAKVQGFWTRRDVESAMAPGSRLREHFRRYEIARNGFRPVEAGFLPAERTLAAKAAQLILLKDCRVAEDSLINAHQARSGLDSAGGVGGQSLLSEAGSLLPGHVMDAEELDVRGIAVMRFGEPDNFAGQFWRFDNEGRNLIFRTNGCHVGDACNLDVRYCNPQPSRELYRQWQQEWKESWDTVRTGNRMRRLFRESLKPVGDAYGLLPTAGDSGRILVTFAVPARQLTQDSVDERVVYPLRIELMATPQSGSYRIDRDTTRRFASTVALGKDDLLQGVEVMSAPPGSYRLRIVFETPDGRRGAIVGDDEIVIAHPTADAVVMSDLVLGRDGSKLTWWSGRERIRLNPAGSVKRSEPLYVYYQLVGLIAGEHYRTSIELFEGGKTDRDPLLALSFDETATEARAELQRTLGLEQVGAGLHTLRVTIRDQRDTIVSQRSSSVRIE